MVKHPGRCILAIISGNVYISLYSWSSSLSPKSYDCGTLATVRSSITDHKRKHEISTRLIFPTVLTLDFCSADGSKLQLSPPQDVIWLQLSLLSFHPSVSGDLTHRLNMKMEDYFFSQSRNKPKYLIERGTRTKRWLWTLSSRPTPTPPLAGAYLWAYQYKIKCSINRESVSVVKHEVPPLFIYLFCSQPPGGDQDALVSL